MKISERVKRAVQAGVAYLDATQPGWFGRINLDRLDLEWGDRCVLGQLEGSYDAAAEKLKLVVPSKLGFDRASEDGETLAPSYQPLTAAWRAIIRRRQRAAPKVAA